MRLESLIARAEAQLQEELGAQRRLERMFAAQERALAADSPAAVTAGLGELTVELDALRQREQRHKLLLAAIAKYLGVAPGAMSYGSLVERAGLQAARLGRARIELLECARGVQKRARKLAILARAQQSILAQVLAEAFAAPGAPPGEHGTTGALIDARA